VRVQTTHSCEACAQVVLKVGELHTFGEYKWVGCIRDQDGIIYLPGKQKIPDGGVTVVPHDNARIDEISVVHRPEGTVLCRSGLLLALDGYVQYRPSSGYWVKTWRSTGNLETIEEREASIDVPQLGDTPMDGLFPISFARALMEMPDGSLLATVQGYFQEDRIVPQDLHSKMEVRYKFRTFLLVSRDLGASWRYYSTIACPRPEDPVGEGFDEPTMVHLDDGRLLCVMRTGHYTPLYSCWSSDGGKSWTAPVYTGLERGCWPCLIKLGDGRLALSYGQRFPPGWSRITPEGDSARYQAEWPGAGLVKLAISPDGTGESWLDTTIGSAMGSCYSTIMETEPNLLFCQVDGWYWRVMLMPRIPDEL